MNAPAEPSRALSPSEHLLWRIDQVVPLNFTVVGYVRGPLTDATLRAALGAVLERHPLLRACIEPSGAHFGPASGVAQVAPDVCGEGRWLAAVTDELNTPFDPTSGPFLRVRWAREGDDRCRLLLTVYHVVGDGHGGVYALRDLLRAASGEALPPLPEPPSASARPPANARGLRAWWRLFANAARDVGRLVVQGMPRGLVAEVTAPNDGRAVHLYAHRFDAETSARMLARARTEKTTIHGLLLAALCQAVVADDQGAATLAIGSPVDLRHRLDPPAGEAAGFFVGMVAGSQRVSAERPLWPLARRIRKDAHAMANNGSAVLFHRLIAWLGGWFGRGDADHRAFAQRLYHFMPAATGLTNLGRLHIPDRYGDLALERVHFFINPSALGDLVSTATGFADCVHWNFCGMAPIVSPERLERVALDAINRTLAAIE